ncbi:MAG: alanine racemase [Balneolaceae bacterium]
MKKHFPASVAQIELNESIQNIKEIKKRTSIPKILAVVKCNAYSHGAIRLSKAVEEYVDWFAVANVDEAIQLRLSGILKPVLVFGVPTYETAAAYQTHNLTATISHQTHFSILMDGTSYHLNFDTGMGRLGFYPEESGEVRDLAVANQRLICSGIYSHYSSADDPGSQKVMDQNRIFKKVLNEFQEIPLIHMSNTGAAVNYDHLDHFGMIRTGLGMLGYNSGSTVYDWLHPVLTWKTKIAQIRLIRKGMSVSYSSTWTAPVDGYLATLPVGYGDGIPRSLSNRLMVSVEGTKVAQVGNITMDMCMLFLGDLKLPTGTDVTLMGGDAWTATDWARHGNTNTHEILTNLTDRISREYID